MLSKQADRMIWLRAAAVADNNDELTYPGSAVMVMHAYKTTYLPPINFIIGTSCIHAVTIYPQGYGKVGSWAAAMLHEAGGKVIAVSDIDSAVHNESGLDIPGLHEHCYKKGGLLRDFPGTSRV